MGGRGSRSRSASTKKKHNSESSKGRDADHLPALLWAGLLAWRLLIAASISTTFDPDESFQSLEIAHRVVWGWGWETWEWREGVRGFAFPALFVPGYALVRWLAGVQGERDMATAPFLLAPRLLMGVLGWAGDVGLWHLARRLVGPRAARYALLCSAASWFMAYCGGRSYSNTLEGILTIWALACWPWPVAGGAPEGGDNGALADRRALGLAALACLVRPTNALVWLFLGPLLLLRSRRRAALLLDVLALGTLYVAASYAIDACYYHRWTFTPLAFLRFNVVQGISLFYGSHPWHWYGTQGMPVILWTYVPWFVVTLIHVARQGDARQRQLVGVIAWTTACMSCLGHKEFRFLFPMLPPCLALVGWGAWRTELAWTARGWGRAFQWLVVGLVASQLAVGLYFTQVHKRGALDVLRYLRTTPNVTGVLFLTPCHAIPLYSHLHAPIPLHMIPCEPPIPRPGGGRHVDLTARLYADPERFIASFLGRTLGNRTVTGVLDLPPGREAYPVAEGLEPAASRGERTPWPSHVVVFEGLAPLMDRLVAGSNYHVCARFFHSHFHDDARQRGQLLVYCPQPE